MSCHGLTWNWLFVMAIEVSADSADSGCRPDSCGHAAPHAALLQEARSSPTTLCCGEPLSQTTPSHAGIDALPQAFAPPHLLEHRVKRRLMENSTAVSFVRTAATHPLDCVRPTYAAQRPEACKSRAVACSR